MWNKLILFYVLISVNIYANESVVSSLNSNFKLDEKYNANRNSIKLITEKFRNHLLEIDIPEWVSKRHHESISTVILSEMISAIHKFGNYKNGDNIIECTVNHPANYSLANFNYLVLINALNFIINCDHDKGAKTIDYVVNQICSMDKYKQFSDKLRTAGLHIKQYMDGLKLYDFLQTVTGINCDRIDKMDYESFEKQYIKSKLPPGIINDRNTCYFNSLFQFLYSNHKIRRIVMEYSKNNGCELSKILSDLFSRMQNENTKINTLDEKNKIFNIINKNKKNASTPQFNKKIQSDASEFYGYIMDSLNEELLLYEKNLMSVTKGRSKYANISNAMRSNYLITRSEVKCKSCGYVGYNNSFCNTLIVSPTEKGLKEAIYTEKQSEESVNDYHCYDKQENNHTVCKYDSYSINDVLCITMKRFKFDSEKCRNIKITDICDFPENLPIENKLYRLRSAIFHSGSVNSGHYICVAYADDGTMYAANDALISKYTYKISESLQQGRPFFINGYREYLLLYERVLWD